MDPARNWTIVGTDQGYYTLWDLRFQLPVRTWRHPGGRKIHKLVYASSNGDRECNVHACTPHDDFAAVTTWDIKHPKCLRVIRANPEAKTSPKLNPILEYENPSIVSQYESSTFEDRLNLVYRQKSYDPRLHSFRALLTDRSSFLITGGTDQTIRFWDLKDPKTSYIISGPKVENKAAEYTNFYDSSVEVFQENWRSRETNEKLSLRAVDTHHNDTILDLKLLEHPHNMLVSSSRDGVIKVFK